MEYLETLRDDPENEEMTEQMEGCLNTLNYDAKKVSYIEKNSFVCLLSPYLEKECIEHDMSYLVSKLEAPVFLQLLFLLKLDTVDQFMIGRSSPHDHRLLMELVRSAKHENFLSFLKFTVSQSKPTDVDSIFECLLKAFNEQNEKD